MLRRNTNVTCNCNVTTRNNLGHNSRLNAICCAEVSVPKRSTSSWTSAEEEKRVRTVHLFVHGRALPAAERYREIAIRQRLMRVDQILSRS